MRGFSVCQELLRRSNGYTKCGPYRLASSLAAALLDSSFEHPDVILTFAPYGKFQPYFWHQPSFSSASYITMPPPAWIFCPVNHRASSLTMNATTSAISLGSPSRFNGDSWMPI